MGNDSVLLKPATKMVELSQTKCIVVDYGKTIEQMVTDGNFRTCSKEIISNRFPIIGEGKVEFEVGLFESGKWNSLEEKQVLIKDTGWEVGKIEHLIVSNITYRIRSMQRLPIVALGSVCTIDGQLVVPYIDSSHLGLGNLDVSLGRGFRYLAVRKKVVKILVA